MGMGDDDEGIEFTLEKKNCQLQYGDYITEKAQWLRIKAKTEWKNWQYTWLGWGERQVDDSGHDLRDDIKTNGCIKEGNGNEYCPGSL